MQYTLPKAYLSASALNCLLTCPRQYQFRYIEKIPVPPSAAMLTGTALHKTFEQYYRGIIENPANRLSSSQTADLAMTAFEDTVTSEENYLTCTEREQASATVRELASAYVETVGKGIVPLAVEEQYQYTSRCGVPLLAFIDLRRQCPDGSEMICDYKIMTKKWTMDKLANSLQFNLYAMITGNGDTEIHNIVKVQPSKRPAALKRTDDLFDLSPNLRVLRFSFDGGAFNHLENLIESAAQLITSGIFMPCALDAWNCTPEWCGYWNLCRGKPQAKAFDMAA